MMRGTPGESDMSESQHNEANSSTTPILTVRHQTSHYGSILTDDEIKSFVQHRRASIASTSASINNQKSLLNDLESGHDLKEPETSLVLEIKTLSKYSVPLIITFLLQYSLTVASVFSVGRLGSTELAAVSLSSMTANISGYAIIQGVSTCLDTLCAQAYGRKDYRMVGVHFLRCTVFLFLLYIPIALIWTVLAEPILVSIIPEKDLCHLAARYLKVLSIGVPGFILFENGKHYLQAQGVFHASTYVLLFCAPLNGFLNYYLVWDSRFGLGFIGAPTAVVITNWVMAMLLFLYAWKVKGSECWYGFTNDGFRNWNRMLKLSAPGVLMVEAEWLAFEIITLSASRFGTVVLAAQSIVSTTSVLLYQIPFAISIASSTRIAWFIGASSKKSAKVSSYASIIMSLILGCFNAMALAIFRGKIASFFTVDEEVLKLASKVLIIGAIYQINDCLACITGGILRGQGRQKIGGYLNLFSYYFIALPIAFLCAFRFHLELIGLWVGMVIALFFVSFLQLYFVWVSDWDQVINDCIQEAILENNGHIDHHHPQFDTLSLVPSVSATSSYHI